MDSSILQGLSGVVLVFEIGEVSFAPDLPCQERVASNEDHVVGVDGSERGQPVTHDCEEGYEDVIDDVNNIGLPASDVDPA